MHVTIKYYPDGVTLTVTPSIKKQHFPPIRKIEYDNGTTYAIPFGLFAERIALGTIPPEYKWQRKETDKYQITFKNNKAPKEKRRKEYKPISADDKLLLLRHRNDRQTNRLQSTNVHVKQLATGDTVSLGSI